MNRLEEPAILVVDMLNDFVTGSLTCDRAKAIVPATARLLEAARQAGVPVIFCNDAHLPGIDRELKIWGAHAIVGTKGAEVIPELNLCEEDYINGLAYLKTCYGAEAYSNEELIEAFK